MRSSSLSSIRETWFSPLSCILIAAGSGFLACYISGFVSIRLAVALPLFCLLLLATKQLRKSDWVYVIQLFRNKK
jgi:hypothetical protein